MIIKDHQVFAFKENGVRDFVSRAILHVFENLGDQIKNKNHNELEKWVRSVIDRAKEFDLLTEKQIIYLLDAEIIMGEKFYEQKDHDWAMKTLSSNKLNSDEKCHILLATICSFDRSQKILG